MAEKRKRRGSNAPRAEELQQAMFEAYHLLHEVHINYQQALAVARDTELSDDGMLDLRNKGRIYAEAVTRYADATMRWLAHVDAHKEEAIKFLRKGAGE